MTAETQADGGGAAEAPKKKSNLVPILIVVGVIVVIAIGAGVYLLTRDSGGGSEKATGKAPPRVAKDLYKAWQAGDRTAAAAVATPTAVDQIFAIKTDEGSGLVFGGCVKAGNTPLPKTCTYSRPGGQLVITVSVVGEKRQASDVKLGAAATTPTSSG